MKLGAFSVSLSVKDLQASRTFYESMGFTAFAGGEEKNYLIMKNENSLIGLFQGMLEGNILKDYQDVREIQRHLKSQGIEVATEADETGSGPGSFMVADPDGNVLLFDQHR